MAALAWIQAKIVKLIDLIFGKTKIFIILLGWFLVITGALFLLRPEKARAKLLSQGFGFIKVPLLFAALYLSLFLFSLSGKFEGGLPTIIAVVGTVVIIKLFFSLKKKTFDKLKEQFAKIPLPMLKLYAGIQILVGALMIILEKRIW